MPVQEEAVGTNHDAEFYYDEEVPQPQLVEQKELSSVSLGAGPEDMGPDAPPVIAAPKQAPARSQKIANRNDKVSVQYMDGRVLRDVKYKTVEQDVLSQRCVLVE